MAVELREIETSSLIPHPDNPRVMLREDVVSAIVANLNGEFPQKHALHVRPIGDQFQILSGHNRHEAAKRKGISKVWCWVDDVDDATAFMELVTSNNQGELSPLEIGIHALKAVPKEQGKKGGGLAAYADRIGKSKQYVGELRQAAEVISTCTLERTSFMERSKHLAVVHKLPPECWQAACEWLAVNDASVADVEKKVSQAVEFRAGFIITDDRDHWRWWLDYLNPVECMSAVFCGADPGTFQRLLSVASKVSEDLESHEDLANQWTKWLCDNSGGDSWKIAKVQEKRIELEQIAWDRDNTEPMEVQTAATLLLADPPWQYDFAETDSRKIENQYPSASVDEICSHINAPWAPKLADDCILYLWATAPKLREAFQVMDAWGFSYKTHAVWDKEKIGMGYWFRGQHELLLVGTRGNASCPDSERRVSSVFREKRDSKHSKKPECVYAAIEAMFPDAVRAEIYQRTARDGWQGCGNEVPK